MTDKQAYSAFAGLSPISPADKAAPAAAAPDLLEKMPDSWVMHLWRNEPRLFVLSGLCKVLWSTCLIGIMSYLHTISDVALGLNNQTKDTLKALKFCFGLIPLMMVYSVANLGKEYFNNEMASKTKARLAALIAEHCVLRATADASERAMALSLASSETNQVLRLSHSSLGMPQLCASGLRRRLEHSPTVGLHARVCCHQLVVPHKRSCSGQVRRDCDWHVSSCALLGNLDFNSHEESTLRSCQP